MLMTSRQEVLSNVYSEVERKLSEIVAEKSGESDYMEILEKLIIEGALGIGGKDFIVSANERDIPRLKKNFRNLTKHLRNLIPLHHLQQFDEPTP